MITQKAKELSAKAAKLYEEEKFEAAQKYALQAVSLDSQNHEALQVIGNVFFVQNDYEKALEFYQKAHRADPQNIADMFNLGNVFLQQRQYKQAALWAQTLLNADAGNINGLMLLGHCLLEEGEFADSILCFEQIIKAESDNFWAYNYYSRALQKSGFFEAAVQAAYQAVELSNGADSQHINMGYCLYEISLEKDIKSIKDILKKWHKKYGGNPLVDYVFSALRSNKNILRSNPVYVRRIFDAFADSFEDSLAALEYQVPQLIAKKYGDLLPENSLGLDIGCGTGLCGVFLDSLNKKIDLWGVDISPLMLSQAASKNIYKNLLAMDIETPFLFKDSLLFDFVTAADVLTYFGRLDKVFSNVFKALKKEGVFIFSVTQNNENKDDYFLHLSGRFLHSKNYVEKLLNKYGFCILKEEFCTLRFEGGFPVKGWIFAARKTQ